MQEKNFSGNNDKKPGSKMAAVYKNNKAVRIASYIVLIVVALVAGLAIGGFFHKPSDDDKTKIAGDVSKYAEDQDHSDVTESDSISIPGYDTFTFKAGEKTQQITLHNPEENTCYFKLSLILEDGTTIWTSDLLEPGMAFKSIELDKTLDKGTYSDVTLKYDCYSLKDQSQLNGAAIKVNIVAE